MERRIDPNGKTVRLAVLTKSYRYFSFPSTNYAKDFPSNLASKFPSSMVSVTYPCKLTGQYCFLLFLTNEFITSYLEDF